MRIKEYSVLPGFGPTLAYTLFYLLLVVLIPLSGLFVQTTSLTWDEFVSTVGSPRVVASYRLTFTAAFVGAIVNVVLGTILAWCIVRYRFFGRSLLDAVVDLPFALPTAVSGLALTAVYSKNGWMGQYLEPFGIKAAFSPLGVTIAMTFIGLPFVVRTLQPALEELDIESEEAAASLGADRLQTLLRVVIPNLLPSIITGFALAFARGLGEYGSVVFISGNMPYKTEITSLLIHTKLEQYDLAGATAISIVMLTASFVVLLAINTVQNWASIGHRKSIA